MKRVILLICLLILCSCGKKLSEKIIGKWQVDPEGTKESLKQEGLSEDEIAAEFKEVSGAVVEFYGAKFKVSNDSKSEEYTYTKESEEGNILKIKINGKVDSIKFIDDDTFETTTDREKPVVLKRKK